MDISIIIPVYNEEESLEELTGWINRVLEARKLTYEIIFVDDGSHDGSWDVVQQLAQQQSQIKGIRFRRNYGKSAALNEGFKLATGKVVITLDADLQDSPDEIPALYEMVLTDGFDLVSGWKKKRKDPINKTLPSKIFNLTTRLISGIRLHDFNCGLKAYRHDVVKSLEIQGEMHRYIPVIAKWAGFDKITEKVVEHRERRHGHSKYGISRFMKGYLDLLTITFITKFGKRPMHFFGSIGSLMFLAGFVIAGQLAYDRLFHQAYKMTERPLFYFGLLAMILGTQLFVTGFLAELMSQAIQKLGNQYSIAERINIQEDIS